jgi:hypothetical protein
MGWLEPCCSYPLSPASRAIEVTWDSHLQSYYLADNRVEASAIVDLWGTFVAQSGEERSRQPLGVGVAVGKGVTLGVAVPAGVGLAIGMGVGVASSLPLGSFL